MDKRQANASKWRLEFSLDLFWARVQVTEGITLSETSFKETFWHCSCLSAGDCWEIKRKQQYVHAWAVRNLNVHIQILWQCD